ncbi:MAG TPA: hypothetical protein VG993_00370 [Actinomycetota bacterium]|jgi:folate-binding protein YgfZ|nr:hypothetical protein [Actinomycetota bacterium]
MQPTTAPADELRALADGSAVVDLSAFRKVRVRGEDSRRWLHDLVTTDVASLEPGSARRSLLLDATGHIRADLQVACDRDGFWLFQDPDQPDHVGAALAPYVLSSDVRLDDMSSEMGLMALPGSSDGTDGFRPSWLGPGRDVLFTASGSLDPPGGRTLVGAAAVEVLRIRQGRARMGAEFDRTSIPAEAGLEATIDTTKGCFLGQESVARVRMLGHPPRVLRHLRAAGVVDPGSSVCLDEGRVVGVVTSAATHPTGGTVILASIRWDARIASLRSEDGSALVPVGSSD